MRKAWIILLVLMVLSMFAAPAAGDVTAEEDTGYSLIIQDDAGLLTHSTYEAQVVEAMQPILQYANVGFLTRPAGDSMRGTSAAKAEEWKNA